MINWGSIKPVVITAGLLASVLTSVLAGLGALSLPARAQPADIAALLPELAQMQQAGLLVMDGDQRALFSQRADEGFVPASTTKLVTAFVALRHWGAEHRFKTEFYLQHRSDGVWLGVKGFGDPFLTSEALNEVAQKLAAHFQQAGVKRLQGMVLDASYYEAALSLPGNAHSANPYDAVPSALAANFNTLYVAKIGGKVVSAEPQTPLTPTAEALSARVPSGKTRLNTGRDAEVGQRYFAELLAAFLGRQGLEVGAALKWQKIVPETAAATPFYTYWNAMTLAEVIKPMMKYSTNFIANQLALSLSAELYGPPATANKVKRLFAEQLKAHFDWQDAYIEEGAGLSRNNRLTPLQLAELLEAFRPWQALLPEVEAGVFAKSGSLLGVSTLAGYIQRRQRWLPFVVMMNEQVPYYHYRNEVAKVLAREVQAQKNSGAVMQAAP